MNANELLLWISAKRMGTWARYRDAFEEMAESDQDADTSGSEEALSDYQRVRLNLERLAHVEFWSQDYPNGWRVVPPTIAITGDENTGILCGARTDSLLTAVQSNAAEVRVTARVECPDCVEIFPDRPWESLASGLGMLIQRQATEALLAAHPPVDDPQLRALRELPFGNDSPVSQFRAATLEWTSSSPAEARRASFGLFRWQVMHDRHYYLKHRNRAFRLPVQVGKYIVLSRERRRVLKFEPATQVLSMPISCRPPLIIDRALTLRTGIIPEIRQGEFIYPKITKEIAAMTSAILRQ